MGNRDRVLGFSVGNSTLRYGALENGRVLWSSSILWPIVSSIGIPLDDLAERVGFRGAVVASVRDDYLKLLESRIPSEFLPLAVARRDFALPIRNLYEDPSEAGTDRLLALVAAHRRSAAAGAVVVDFGTAITISVVSPTGDFLGGTISAGAGTLARGLSITAPRLPPIRVEAEDCDSTLRDDAVILRSSEEYLAKGTRAALRTGVFWSVAGGVRALLGRVLESVEFRPRVFATGGEANIFCGAIPEVAEIVPDLVLEGLAVAVEARGA